MSRHSGKAFRLWASIAPYHRVGLEQNRWKGLSVAERIGFSPGEDHEIASPKGDVTLTMLVRGKRPISHLVAAIGDIDGVQEVGRVDRGAEFE